MKMKPMLFAIDEYLNCQVVFALILIFAWLGAF
jgi:hypothetical protein